ncbi:MAG: winged helix-turn-helix domain-containing protein [Bdellovibrio sp.]
MRGRPLGSGKKLEERRLQAVREVEIEGSTPISVAKKYKVEIGTIYRWCGIYRKYKKKGLKSRPTPGAPRRMTAAQLEKLEALLLKGARSCGFANDLWTCPRIKDLIKDRFGVDYHVDHIVRLLGRMGWSAQRPAKQAIEKDDKRIREWVKKDLPAIKKKPAN